MTQVIDLGKLRFYFAGQYANSTTYEQNDVVKYGGNVYVYIYSLKTSGNAPTNTTYWRLMIEGFSFDGRWDSTSTFNIGDGVAYGGKVFVAVKQSTNIKPTGRDSYWSTFADGIQWEGDYGTDSSYQKNDIVRYGGSTYIAKGDTAGNLPSNATYWDQFVEGISYQAVYNNATAYKKDHVVAYGANLYKAKTETTGNIPTSTAHWDLYVGGTQFRGGFDSSSSYFPNDLVSRGGNLYRARVAISGTAPNADSDANYKVVVSGFQFDSDWSSTKVYAPGTTVRFGGSLWKSISSGKNLEPPTNATYWTKIVPGFKFKGDWATSTAYQVDDVVRHGGNSYIAVTSHASTTFKANETSGYWTKFNSGIRFRGAYAGAANYNKDDIVTSSTSAYIVDSDYTSTGNFANDLAAGKFSIFAAGDASTGFPTIAAGDVGKVIAVNSAAGAYELSWPDDALNNFFVSKDQGTDDSNHGRSKNAPFKTIRFALNYINANTTDDSAAHLEISEGKYEEILPMTVPPMVSIRGQGLRNTEIAPATGYDSALSMFYLNNGNLLEGLLFTGMTGGPNGILFDSAEPDNLEAAYDSDATYPGSGHAARTIKGAFLRLDPTRRIATKSPYIKHCSAFSTGGIGAIIDGKHLSTDSTTIGSMVFHAFTQIHSDGIGFWCRRNGKSEIVSCFTYYCKFGYASTKGGQIRALNGNNSYGTYGAIGEGFDSSETPVTGNVRGNQLTFVDGSITNGEFEKNDIIQTPSRYETRTLSNITKGAVAQFQFKSAHNLVDKDRIKINSISPAGWAASVTENQELYVTRNDSFNVSAYTDSSRSIGYNSSAFASASTSAVTIQDLVRANPMRLTVLSHNFDSFSLVKITGVGGTTQANDKYYVVDSNTSTTLRLKSAENSYITVTGDSTGYALSGKFRDTTTSLVKTGDSAINVWRGSRYYFVQDSAVARNPMYITTADSNSWIMNTFASEYTTSAFGRTIGNSRATGDSDGTENRKPQNARTLKVTFDSNAPSTLYLASGKSKANFRQINIINPPSVDATSYSAYTSGGTVTMVDSGLELDSAKIEKVGTSATVINSQNAIQMLIIDQIKGSGFRGGDSIAESGGTVFAKLKAVDPVTNNTGFTLAFKGFSAKPKTGGSLSYVTTNGLATDSGYDSNSYVIQSVTDFESAGGTCVIVFTSQKDGTLTRRWAYDSQPVKLRYNYSQVRLTGHDFLNIGFGNKTQTNYPGTPSGALAQGNEVIEKNTGRVYFVSTDQDGNFRVGNYFRIDQATGRATLDASAFDLAGLTSLRLGSIGAKLGETINEFSSDGSLAGNSNIAVPTEQAVKTYVDGQIVANVTKSLPTSAQTGGIATEQFIGFDIGRFGRDDEFLSLQSAKQLRNKT
tara:strand:- start:1922 stop:6055 length:4134 start_codon:yes stop_codon:yes gene_type:complete